MSAHASGRYMSSVRRIAPGSSLSDVRKSDGSKRYARTGTNEGENAFAIAAFTRVSKFALVRCPMICEVTDVLSARVVERAPIDAGHPLEKRKAYSEKREVHSRPQTSCSSSFTFHPFSERRTSRSRSR